MTLHLRCCVHAPVLGDADGDRAVGVTKGPVRRHAPSPRARAASWRHYSLHSNGRLLRHSYQRVHNITQSIKLGEIYTK